MRHRKNTARLGRTNSHQRCMIANMLKSLITNESIVTTVDKAKELRRHADKLITLAKRNDLSARRQAIASLMVRFNHLTPKEARETREGSDRHLNDDRKVIEKLFDQLGGRFSSRQGGYTRIVKSSHRVGDCTQQCVIEYLPE